jgi:mannose-6-phosphate isomerase-like protein (cupin superfamily)
MRQIRTDRISAKNIKKRSDYQSKYERPELISIPKNREKTKTGFVAKGYAGASFELVYEVMAAGAASPTYMHPKKDRVIRILSGSGLLHTGGNNYVKILAGEDITIEAGTQYSITAESDLYLMLIQPSKYLAHLNVDESTCIAVDMDTRIEEVPDAPTTPVYTRGPSKAAIQLRELSERRRGPVPTTPPPVAQSQSVEKPHLSPLGNGPMPTYGEDLAGDPG